MELVVNGKTIEEPIINILEQIKKECSWQVFDKIVDKGDYISCTCPYHKDGHERKPSFSVYSNYNGNVIPGTFHCFTCDKKGQLYQLVSYCLDIDEEQAKDWLANKFSTLYVDTKFELPDLIDEKKEDIFLDECILEKYAYFHTYMFQRKLTEEVIRKFKIGYDKERNAITFPVWNENNKLVGITERCVDSKKFYIPAQIEKPVYLFNFIKNSDYPFAIVCESQIDALTAWGYGVPAVAMLGLGSKEQYDILNKIHINWVTMFDGDSAGKEATKRFNKLIRKDCFVTNIDIPQGKKDINDLSKKEFDDLLGNYGLTWRIS